MTRSFPLSPSAAKALSILEEHGFESYVVGGCVRDFLMNQHPHDFDICSAASPEETKQVFKDYHVIPTGEKHGTITVMMAGEPLEITTFRKDGDYLDGRHPEKVQFTSAIEEDLKRRDFTINAMAYSPTRGLKDPFHGQEDLRAGLLRCVGEAEKRFTEDALRLLRALRFAARLEFAIEQNTAQALHVLAPAISKVSRERVLSEMNGLLAAKGLKQVMTDFADVVTSAVPELRPLTLSSQWEKTLDAVTRAPADITLRWAALLSPLGENTARLTLENLKASKALTEDASVLVRHHDAKLDVQKVKPMLRLIGPDMFRKLVLLQKATGQLSDPEVLILEAERILEKGECYQLSMLAINGNDLKAMGFSGQMIGKTLNALLDQVIQGRLPNEKNALMTFCRRLYP